MAHVRLEGITKSFGGHAAVSDLDLEIEDGQFFVLLGPTGAGKTTTLRLIAGLERPDSGAIFLDRQNVNGWSPAQRDVALVLQQFSLYPRYTVRENLEFPLRSRARRYARAQIAERVARAAAIVRVEHLLDRKTDRLSGGEMQRVSIGRAIVRQPRIFLMDEPLSNLDAKLRVQTRTELVELQSRLAVTTVYVTHDQVEAMTMGHRVAVLRDGILQQCDTPSMLYHSPANLFVAGFIGSPAMNQLHVSATGPLLISGADVGIAEDFGGERAAVGFRPEAVVIGSGPIAARIRVIEDLGSEVFVHLVIQHEGEDHRIVAKTAAPFAGALGDNVQIGLRGDAHLFDTSEARRATVTV
jgi:multiple sugar transport system ATP-binding protein